MKIYTKTGDTGQTSLIGGTKVSKDHLRVACYGTIDELNSHIGLILSYDIAKSATAELSEVQQLLFAIGALLAAAIQTFLKTSLLLEIGQGKLSGNAVMMALSYVMSLCSQADAFVASSFRSTFSPSSLVAFLVFGAMFDIKNTIMLLGTFKTKFVLCLMAYIFISVLGLTLLFIS